MELGEPLVMFKLYNNPTGYSNVQYWKDENGQDWYDYADKAGINNMKVLVDKNNVVVSFNKDATALNPNESSLYEIDFNDLPEDLDIVRYSYDGKNFFKTPLPEKAETAEEIKTKLLLLMLENPLSDDDRIEMEKLKTRLEKLIKEK